MTEERRPLAELLAKSGDGDFLRGVAEAVVQLLMETDVEGLIGAGRHERSGERTTYRNGYRDRTLDTRLGALQLRIPKLRQGRSYEGGRQSALGDGVAQLFPGGDQCPAHHRRPWLAQPVLIVLPSRSPFLWN